MSAAKIVSIGMAGLLAVAALAGKALAAEAGTPPPWSTLVKCAEIGDEDDRLACYDAAMRSAGYAPKPAVVAEEKRKRFGLTVPKLKAFKRDKDEQASVKAQTKAEKAARKDAERAREQAEDEVDVRVNEVAITQPGDRVIIFTTDGQIWSQTDNQPVSPLPRDGDEVHIKKGKLGGGYFCDMNKYVSVRCRRDR